MARVLLLGPDKGRANDIRGLLTTKRHQVTWLRSLAGWREEERQLLPEIVVAAVNTSDRVLQESAGPVPGFPAPLLFVQEETEFTREPGSQDRLVDLLSSPFMSEEFLGRVDALVRVRRVVMGTGTAMRSMQAKSDRGSRRLRRISDRVSAWVRARFPSDELPAGPYLEVAARVAEWADRRDAFEPGHAERVTSFCSMIAEGLDMGEQETSLLLRSAMLHDIGKVGLPIEMLHRKGPMTEHQMRLLRTHASKGAALLRALDPDELVARVVLYHHERPDGSGYHGTTAGAVPRAAYALAVAETFDAMTSSRIQKRCDTAGALEYLRSNRGDHYDRECVDALEDQLRPRTRGIPLSELGLGVDPR